MNVSAPTGNQDDAYWQRPDPSVEGGLQRPPAPKPQPSAPTYQGPPRAQAPSPFWRPPVVAQPPPPRVMPGQDLGAVEEDEGSARTVTYGVGLVAAAIALILMFLLCARIIF
jgi:hypothetical protein